MVKAERRGQFSCLLDAPDQEAGIMPVCYTFGPFHSYALMECFPRGRFVRFVAV